MLAVGCGRQHTDAESAVSGALGGHRGGPHPDHVLRESSSRSVQDFPRGEWVGPLLCKTQLLLCMGGTVAM